MPSFYELSLLGEIDELKGITTKKECQRHRKYPDTGNKIMDFRAFQLDRLKRLHNHDSGLVVYGRTRWGMTMSLLHRHSTEKISCHIKPYFLKGFRSLLIDNIYLTSHTIAFIHLISVSVSSSSDGCLSISSVDFQRLDTVFLTVLVFTNLEHQSLINDT